MITKLSYLTTKTTYPYANLALEEYLFNQVEPEECILYLWQNRQTVVVGRNQNSWQECKVALLESEGGHLVRRLSGGGAVFHDLGNLNFTFLVQKPNYNLNRQLQVIIQALANLGLNAEKSGRNDLTIKGQKFSGNAFYHSGGRSYHHGTLLINSKLEDLTKYLTVDPAKFKAKGVESVRSRVTNLTDFKPDLTPEIMAASLIKAFGQVYGGNPHEILPDTIPKTKLDAGTAKFKSPEWLHPKEIPFSYELKHRFPWGDIQLRLQVSQGKIYEAQVFSDAMGVDFIPALKAALKDGSFSATAMGQKISKIPLTSDFTATMSQDLQDLLRSENI